jgi:hypothetical protein
MPHKKINLDFTGEKIMVSVSGEAAKSALAKLCEQLSVVNCKLTTDNAGLAAIEMFLQLFGEEVTEKLLRFCERKPKKAVKKFAKLIRKKIYPLAVRQRRYEDRQGVKKYL